MSVGVYVGSFAKATVTGNQDITIPVDLTAAAAGTWAIKFFSATYNTAGSTDTFTAHAQPMVGFTTGAANSYAATAGMTDAAGTSNTARRIAAKCVTVQDLSGGAFFDEADFVSFPDATHMRLNWTSQSAGTGAIQVSYIIFTGLTNAQVLSWTTPTSAIDKSVTGLTGSWTPELVLHAIPAITGSVPQSGSGAYIGYGMMNKHGQQGANSIFSVDAAVGASNTTRGQQTDACLYTVENNEQIDYQASFKSMDAGGFTVNFSTAIASACNVISLCMAGASSKIGAFAKATATGVQSVDSRQGFTPKGLILSTFGIAGASAPSVHAQWMFGATDGTNQRSSVATDLDAQATTIAKSAWSNTKLVLLGTSSVHSDGAFSAWDTASFSVNWTTNAGGSEEILYLLVGDSGTNTYPQKIAV
jgi:hypothetical protein